MKNTEKFIFLSKSFEQKVDLWRRRCQVMEPRSFLGHWAEFGGVVTPVIHSAQQIFPNRRFIIKFLQCSHCKKRKDPTNFAVALLGRLFFALLALTSARARYYRQQMASGTEEFPESFTLRRAFCQEKLQRCINSAFGIQPDSTNLIRMRIHGNFKGCAAPRVER